MTLSEAWLAERLRENPHLRLAAEPLERAGTPSPGQQPGHSCCALGRPADARVAGGESAAHALRGSPDPLALAVLPQRRFSGVRLGPEDAVQAAIVRRLDEGTRAGEWDLVCAMCANEVRVPPGKPRVAKAMGARLLAMGLLPGLPDILVIWPGEDEYYGGFGFLEVKRAGGEPVIAVREGALVEGRTRPGRLSSPQRAFRALAHGWRLPWACVRSVDEALKALKGWGAIP